MLQIEVDVGEFVVRSGSGSLQLVGLWSWHFPKLRKWSAEISPSHSHVYVQTYKQLPHPSDLPYDVTSEVRRRVE